MNRVKDWLDFVQGVIDREYLLKDMEDPNKSIYYNQGLRFAAFRDIDETMKMIRKMNNYGIRDNKR